MENAMVMTPAHYDQLASGAAPSPKLLPQVTCPIAGSGSRPRTCLWVSEHVDLLGDALLGPERQQRFLPSRYTLQGDAIDAKGMTCAEPGLSASVICRSPAPCSRWSRCSSRSSEPRQRQVVLLDGDDLAVAPGLAAQFQGRLHRRRPGIESGLERMRGRRCSSTRTNPRSFPWAA